MKSLPAGMQDHLDGGTTTLSWCWIARRKDGITLGFTDHDMPIEIEGIECEPDAGWTGSQIRSTDDMAIDSMDVEGVLRSDKISEEDILDGRWDDAAVEVWRVNWSEPEQRVLMRRGAIGEIQRGDNMFSAEIRSLSHLLGQPTGRTFQNSCDATLGDARCGINLNDFRYYATGEINTVLRDRAFTIEYTPTRIVEDGLWSFGLVEWTTGDNAGRESEILLHEQLVIITLLDTPIKPLKVGDEFTLRAGCNRTFKTCRDRYENQINYRGFPHIPGTDSVVRIAKRGGANSGAVIGARENGNG